MSDRNTADGEDGRLHQEEELGTQITRERRPPQRSHREDKVESSNEDHQSWPLVASLKDAIEEIHDIMMSSIQGLRASPVFGQQQEESDADGRVLIQLSKTYPEAFAHRYELTFYRRRRLTNHRKDADDDGDDNDMIDFVQPNVLVIQWALGLCAPNVEVLCAIARAYPAALKEPIPVFGDIKSRRSRSKRLPIHVLLTRMMVMADDTRFPLSMLRCFIELCPESLWERENDGHYLPIHFACRIFSTDIRVASRRERASTALIELMLDVAEKYCCSLSSDETQDTTKIVMTNRSILSDDLGDDDDDDDDYDDYRRLPYTVSSLLLTPDPGQGCVVLHALCNHFPVDLDFFARVLHLEPNATSVVSDPWEFPVHFLLSHFSKQWQETRWETPPASIPARMVSSFGRRLELLIRHTDPSELAFSGTDTLHLLWGFPLSCGESVDFPDIWRYRLLWLELFCEQEHGIPRSTTRRYPLHSIVKCSVLIQEIQMSQHCIERVLRQFAEELCKFNDEGRFPLQVFLERVATLEAFPTLHGTTPFDRITSLRLIQQMLELEPNSFTLFKEQNHQRYEDRNDGDREGPQLLKQSLSEVTKIRRGYHPILVVASVRSNSPDLVPHEATDMQLLQVDVLYRMFRVDPKANLTSLIIN